MTSFLTPLQEVSNIYKQLKQDPFQIFDFYQY